MKREYYFLAFLILVMGICFVEPSFATTGGQVNQAVSTWWTELKQALQGNIGRLLAVAAAGGGFYALYKGAWAYGILGLLIAYGIYKLPGTVEAAYTLTF
ncbi:MAG TPA: hypothetical protein EYH58_02585 [Aquifex aeolicus]|nr:hypothetical protein [Aquifex aeolicus]